VSPWGNRPLFPARRPRRAAWETVREQFGTAPQAAAPAPATGDTQFAIDQPDTLFASYGNPAIADVGRHLDTLVAGLLGKLGANAPSAKTG
jgi:hypothetical protein